MVEPVHRVNKDTFTKKKPSLRLIWIIQSAPISTKANIYCTIHSSKYACLFFELLFIIPRHELIKCAAFLTTYLETREKGLGVKIITEKCAYC